MQRACRDDDPVRPDEDWELLGARGKDQGNATRLPRRAVDTSREDGGSAWYRMAREHQEAFAMNG
jgi:hypothetical protein